MKTYTREDQQRRAAHDICRRMDDVYGRKAWQSHYQPFEELVLTILSQHTSNANAERAFRELRQRFPDWNVVRAAPTQAVAGAIRTGGLANRKAPCIQAVLKRVLTDRSRMLDSLAELPMSEAKAWLMTLPGVGPKRQRPALYSLRAGGQRFRWIRTSSAFPSALA